MREITTFSTSSNSFPMRNQNLTGNILKNGTAPILTQPLLKMLSKKSHGITIDTEMPLNEFENYYKHLQTMSNADAFVDLSSVNLEK